MRIFTTESMIKDSLSLHIFRKEEILPCPLHTHDFIEIKYILSGNAVETIDGKNYRVQRGDLLWIPYGATHAFTPEDRFAYYNICFAPEVVAKRISNRQDALDLLTLTTLNELQDEGIGVGNLFFSEDERRWIECVLQDMQAEYDACHADRNAVLESYMTVLLAKIVRKMRLFSESCHAVDDVWRALAEFIDENLDQKLTLASLAEKCFYNPSYFSRIFKRKFGVSPVEYIGRERAKTAAKLLKTTAYSVEEIACRCGFGDKTSLYRVFEKEYGCTPSEYRQNEHEKSKKTQR